MAAVGVGGSLARDLIGGQSSVEDISLVLKVLDGLGRFGHGGSNFQSYRQGSMPCVGSLFLGGGRWANSSRQLYMA